MEYQLYQLCMPASLLKPSLSPSVPASLLNPSLPLSVPASLLNPSLRPSLPPFSTPPSLRPCLPSQPLPPTLPPSLPQSFCRFLSLLSSLPASIPLSPSPSLPPSLPPSLSCCWWCSCLYLGLLTCLVLLLGAFTAYVAINVKELSDDTDHAHSTLESKIDDLKSSK